MNKLTDARILVIGGAGFIGSHVVDELTKEDVKEIVIYDNFCRGSIGNLKIALRDPRVRIYEGGGDICQTDILESAMEGIDYVIHLAALWLLQCYEYPRAAFDVNIRGTFNVLESCLRHKIKRLIYSSSASVYGNAVEVPMTEEHPYNNRTFYGATKIAGEQMCRAFYHRYGLEYVGLRYMNVYGPRQDHRGVYTSVIMKVLDRLDQGLPPIVFGDGSQCYDFIHVTDVARANVCALKSDATDQFLNVGAGIRTSVKELVEIMLKMMGSNLEIEYRPQHAEQTLVTHRVGSTEKARRTIGFEARIPLEKGVRSVIEWRRTNKRDVEDDRAGSRI